MVSFDGETLIKQAFSNDSVRRFSDKEASKENASFDSEILKLLQENIEILRIQLEIKDKQIAELTATVKTQAESINIDRNNELAGTLIEGQRKFLDVEAHKQKRWRFWKKIFKTEYNNYVIMDKRVIQERGLLNAINLSILRNIDIHL